MKGIFQNRLLLVALLLFAACATPQPIQTETGVAESQLHATDTSASESQLRTPAAAPMEYVDVCERPGNCRRLSRLIMGTDHIGKRNDAELNELLAEAVRLGINAFDTAPIYIHSIEQRLGQWLKNNHRTNLHVITKGGFPFDTGPGTYSSRLKGTSRDILANVSEELAGSNSRLNDSIAIWLMHRDDGDFLNYRRMARPQTPVRTILEALSDPSVRSRYGMLGVSNWSAARVDQAQMEARKNPGLVRPVASSPYFSLLEMGPVTIHSGGAQVTHRDMMNPGFQRGVKMMTYSPLGGFSILSVGWDRAKQNALDLRNRGDRYWGNVYASIFHQANEKRIRRAEAFTAEFNRRHQTQYTLDQMLNAYVLAHPRADFLIIGPTTVAQLRRSVEALRLSKMLTPQDLNYLYQN